MKTAVYSRFGPPEVIQILTLARPEPKDDEIRLRIFATTVTSACGMMRRGDTLMARLVLGLFGPRSRFQIAGIEFAGTIDSVGRTAQPWHVGIVFSDLPVCARVPTDNTVVCLRLHLWH